MIYVVEDDAGIRELEMYALRQAGYDVKGFEEGESFLEALAEEQPELVLLDVMLPGQDGVTILKSLRARERGRRLPVILVTAKSAEMDKVTGLDSGADDYITKPFGVMELLSRVRAVLRRAKPSGDSVSIGTVTIDRSERSCKAGASPVALTRMEFELLMYLMQSPNIVFTREALLDAVWRMEYAGDTRTVDAHIRSLRQKLGTGGAIIQTVRGVGYRVSEE